MVRTVLDTQILANNQIYNQQKQQNFAHQQQLLSSGGSAAEQVRTYSGAKDVALANTNAGYVASKFDIMQHPLTLVQNIFLSLAAAIGITRLGEVLVNPNYKKISPLMTHEEAIEKTPLHKIGKGLDNLIEKTKILPKIIEKTGEWKNKFVGFLKKSDILSEMGSKVKDGTKVLWGMGKVYEGGKGVEALDEFMDFIELAKTPQIKGKESISLYEEVIPDAAARVRIDEIFKEFKEGKLVKDKAAKKIIDEKLLEKIPVDNLRKHLKEGSLDKIFGTTPHLNTSLAKAKFFNSNVKTLGPVSKALNNFTLMIMEGVGGGVLGGKMAMVMSIMGLVSAFNACSKALVAKKEKEKLIQEGNFNSEQVKEMKKGPWSGEPVSAFMEDFAGFTLGGYIMTFPLGVGLNKVLGLANLGRDGKLVEDAAKKMGIHGDSKLYQRSLMDYNDAVLNDKKMTECIQILEGKRNHKWFDRVKKTFGFTTDEDIYSKMVEKLKLDIDPKSSKDDILSAIKVKKASRTDNWFKDTRKMLKEAGKSQLTWGSIFKENAYNKGGFFKRLTRFALQKPLEVTSKIVGLGKFKLYEKGAGFKNFFKRWGGRAGGIGRIVLVGMVFTVPFRNAFMTVSHKLFGKPSFSQYDEVKGLYDEEKIEKQRKKLTEEASSVKQISEQAPRSKIKLPQQEFDPMLQPQPPVYQQQMTPSNPYESNVKEAKPSEDKKPVENNSVRNLDNYTYIPKI